MSIFEVWLAGYGVVFVLMTLVWLISVAITNVGIIDIAWGFGYVALAWTYYVLAEGDPSRKLLITTLVTVWGMRLTLHIARRNIGKAEDYRYQDFRQKYGAKSYWWRSFFQAFMLQGLLIVIIIAPVLMSSYSPEQTGLTIFDYVGLAIWLIGFGFEAVGDWQLARFKSNPANQGQVLRTGLWRYTRHPNYFGDAVVWWAYFIIALGTPFGFLSIFAPVIMTLLLLRVSGVAMLERSLRETKPAYAEYIRCTSAFIPKPPKC